MADSQHKAASMVRERHRVEREEMSKAHESQISALQDTLTELETEVRERKGAADEAAQRARQAEERARKAEEDREKALERAVTAEAAWKEAEAAASQARAVAEAANYGRKKAEAEAVSVAMAARAATAIVAREVELGASSRIAPDPVEKQSSGAMMRPATESPDLQPTHPPPPPLAAKNGCEAPSIALPLPPPAKSPHASPSSSQPSTVTTSRPATPSPAHGLVLPPMRLKLTSEQQEFEKQRVYWLKHHVGRRQFGQAMELVVSNEEEEAVRQFLAISPVKKTKDPTSLPPTAPARWTGKFPGEMPDAAATRPRPSPSGSPELKAPSHGDPLHTSSSTSRPIISHAGSTISSLYSSFSEDAFPDYDEALPDEDPFADSEGSVTDVDDSPDPRRSSNSRPPAAADGRYRRPRIAMATSSDEDFLS
eukprot:scaffold17473_cov30-Tisochrysis_lutea.AAC.1